ncbi:pirin family protein [Pelagerythrobacter marensis]|nr:pirin family protein [Pelagerythrobacter marensis]
MKTPDTILRNYSHHWMDNGEPVKRHPRGVGEHPHKGFEPVTIVYDGEVSHRDFIGGGGTIGAGEAQRMIADCGVLHEEFRSPGCSGRWPRPDPSVSEAFDLSGHFCRRATHSCPIDLSPSPLAQGIYA